MKSINLESQGELSLEGLGAMAVTPRCVKTLVNFDLHLLAYDDPVTGCRS